MSWKNVSASERGPWLETAAQIVRDVVTAYRRRGAKVQHAFADAALDLDTTPRRIRALYYRDGVWAVAREEHDRLMRRWGRHLDEQMAQVQREAEAIQERRAQLKLNLDASEQDTGETWLGGGTALQRGLRGEGGPQ